MILPSNATILVIDDNPQNLVLIRDLLDELYIIKVAPNGPLGIRIASANPPDLILLDIMMPDMDGYEVCRQLKSNPLTSDIPVIFLTALATEMSEDKGFSLGAVDYVTKPISPTILLARVRAQLQLRAASNALKETAATIKSQADQLEKWNKTLEQRVEEQIRQLDRLGQLKRFFSPQLVDIIVSEGDDILKTHRREVSTVFVDIRGFTAFTEKNEPEQVMQLLQEFHGVAGKIIMAHNGTLERFAGDAILIFFNDPIPMDDHAQQAVNMAIAIQAAFADIASRWSQRDCVLGLGCGIALGYATIGKIGFEGRWDYAAIGGVINLASRLCAEASCGEILIDQKMHAVVCHRVHSTPKGMLTLKGFNKPMSVFSVTGIT